MQPIGANQSGVRAHNERLVLSMLRRHGSQSKADIARITGLSAQTITVIIRNLEAVELLRREDPVKGRVGQPSVPMTLNATGAYSIGLRIGRRGADLTLMDFVGEMQEQFVLRYPYPTPDKILRFVADQIAALTAGLSDLQRARIIGMGVGAPFELWQWLDQLNAPKEEMAAWRNFDIARELEAVTGLNVLVENDASCACLPEQMLGHGRQMKDFAYFFIGSFIGGGIVLNHKCFTGPNRNAGAFGPLTISAPVTEAPAQLLDVASLFLLERKIGNTGSNAAILRDPDADWYQLGAPLDDWIDVTAKALVRGASNICAIIDFSDIVIDGAMPRPVLDDLISAVERAARDHTVPGIIKPKFHKGTIGANARALGASMLPISAKFLLETRHFEL